MAVESADDRAVFVDGDEFGVAVAYTPDGGSTVMLTGIFDAVDESLPFGEVGVVSASPTLTCRSADLPTGAGEGDAVEIDGQSWRVAAPIRRDGTGMSILTLEEV